MTWERVARLDVAAALAAVQRATGVRLGDDGMLPGGSVGALRVRWPDGRRSVLTAARGDADQLRATPLAVVERLRAVGHPAPRTECLVPDGGRCYLVQELLPGAPAATVDVRLLDQLLALVDRQAGVLADRPDIAPVPLHLTQDGPGFCRHEPLARHSAAGARLESWVRAVGAECGSDASVGDDAVHVDLQPTNVLVDHGRISGIVDWDGAGRGDRLLDLVALRFGLQAGPGTLPARRRLNAILDCAEPARLRPAWAHLALRMGDWAVRHFDPAAAEDWIAFGLTRAEPAGRSSGRGRHRPTVSSVTDATTDGDRFTEAEIEQQPDLWSAVLGQNRDEATRFAGRDWARVVLTGAGTSAYAGQVVAPHLARDGRRSEAVATTDIVADPGSAFGQDVPTLLVSFARSGDSPESLAAVELADRVLDRVGHLVLTCNPDGTLARQRTGRDGSQVVLMPAAANDRGFAMTSSFTCMTLTALLTLGGLDVDAVALADAGRDALARRAEIDRLAATRPSRLVYLGSGPLTGLARESALKSLELTAGSVPALAESTLGFRHGPKSFLTPDTATLVYVSNDPYTRRYDLDLLAELAAARRAGAAGQVVAVTAARDGLPDGITVWDLPGAAPWPDAVAALPFVVHAQLLALALSRAHGLTPDNPFPGGEVNRVVQGVTIHPLP